MHRLRRVINIQPRLIFNSSMLVRLAKRLSGVLENFGKRLDDPVVSPVQQANKMCWTTVVLPKSA